MIDRTLSSLATGGTGIRVRDVQVAACRVLGVRFAVMSMPTRGVKAEWHARQIAIAVALEITGRTLPLVARYLGHRDHTTMIYARRQVALRLQRDPGYAEQVEAVRAAAIAEAEEVRARWQRLADALRGGHWVPPQEPDPVPERNPYGSLLGRIHPVPVIYHERAAP